MADSNPAASPLKQSPEKNEELQDSGTKIKQENEVQESSPLSNSPKEEGVQPIGARIKDLDESQSELLARIQGLKQNVQSWRSLVDTQLKSYKDNKSTGELSFLTCLMNLGRSVARLFTSMQENTPMNMILGCLLGVLMNGIILSQILVYRPHAKIEKKVQ